MYQFSKIILSVTLIGKRNDDEVYRKLGRLLGRYFIKLGKNGKGAFIKSKNIVLGTNVRRRDSWRNRS